MSDMEPKTRESWKLIEKLVMQNSKQIQKQQRWTIFFRLVFVVYFGMLLWMAWPSSRGDFDMSTADQIAVVSVDGIIAAGSEANAELINEGLDSAFASKSRVIMLDINSPGGSPVQAGQVFRHIRYLKDKHADKTVVAVISDVGASGAYYIAAAADEIYADPASIVGSIGVIMDGFGLEGTMKKLGAERRVLTAGNNKAILDPFQPLDPKHKALVQSMLNDIHQQFIAAVKEGRGDRLKAESNPDIFSGLFWTGSQALELGLVDGLGSKETVARDLTGDSNLLDYTSKPDKFEELLRKFGVSIGQSFAHTVGLDVNQTNIH